MPFTEKALLRSRIKAEAAAFTPQQLAECSGRLAEALEQEPHFRQAATVVLFHSLPDEPGTHRLCDHWWRRKRVLLPVVQGGSMQLRQYAGKASLRRGAYGISEPQGETFERWGEIDFVLVPGMAFDAAGHRLGRGGGYYDRFLSAPELRAYRLGFCYPFQLLGRVPVEPHDVPVDAVLTLPSMKETFAK